MKSASLPSFDVVIFGTVVVVVEVVLLVVVCVVVSKVGNAQTKIIIDICKKHSFNHLDIYVQK